MDMIKKLLTYAALMVVLGAVIVYAIPLMRSAGQATVDDGVRKISEIRNSIR